MLVLRYTRNFHLERWDNNIWQPDCQVFRLFELPDHPVQHTIWRNPNYCYYWVWVDRSEDPEEGAGHCGHICPAHHRNYSPTHRSEAPEGGLAVWLLPCKFSTNGPYELCQLTTLLGLMPCCHHSNALQLAGCQLWW